MPTYFLLEALQSLCKSLWRCLLSFGKMFFENDNFLDRRRKACYKTVIVMICAENNQDKTFLIRIEHKSIAI